MVHPEWPQKRVQRRTSLGSRLLPRREFRHIQIIVRNQAVTTSLIIITNLPTLQPLRPRFMVRLVNLVRLRIIRHKMTMVRRYVSDKTKTIAYIRKPSGRPSRPGGCWYCLTGINLDEGPEECGPRTVYCMTGLQPGQHSGYCCHGCCHVRV